MRTSLFTCAIRINFNVVSPRHTSTIQSMPVRVSLVPTLLQFRSDEKRINRVKEDRRGDPCETELYILHKNIVCRVSSRLKCSIIIFDMHRAKHVRMLWNIAHMLWC